MTSNVNISATGAISELNLGSFKYLLISAATLPFELSFDSQTWQPANLNSQWGPEAHDRIFFRAVGGLASVVTVTYSNSPFSRIPDSKQQISSTYAKATKVINISTVTPTVFPGTDGGHRRKSISIAVQPPSTGADQDFLLVTAGGVGGFCISRYVPFVPLETDAAIGILRDSGTPLGAIVNVLEIFYSDAQ